MRDFLDIVKKRKSIRSFVEKEVSRDTIERILDCAREAPTNCNQQRWNFVVVDDLEVKETLIKQAASNTMFRRAPVLIAVTYDGWNTKEAIQGASLAVGHILLAAEYYGLGALPMNSFGGEKKVKRVLGIPKEELLCCFVALGYPDERAENAPPVPRRPLSEVVHWNAFEKREQPVFTYNPDDWSLGGLCQHHRHYCRKTFIGKEMDLAGRQERELVRRKTATLKTPMLDLFSYDGSYTQLFPDGVLHTVDLTPETAMYTRAAAQLSGREVSESAVYYSGGKRLLKDLVQSITLIYKAERIPHTVLVDVLRQSYETLAPGGELVIIARKNHLFFRLFFAALKLAFGKDVRKTGIFAFFGPYKPVRVGKLMRMARDAGFEQVSWSGYFAFPAFVEQLYQMAAQYIKSEGSSYLHRERRVDWISKSIDAILEVQGVARVGILGSVAVIVCKKK